MIKLIISTMLFLNILKVASDLKRYTDLNRPSCRRTSPSYYFEEEIGFNLNS